MPSTVASEYYIVFSGPKTLSRNQPSQLTFDSASISNSEAPPSTASTSVAVASTATTSAAVAQECQSASDVGHSESDQRLPAQKRRRIVPTSKKRMTNASYLAQSLSLQSKSLQMEREKVRLQKQMAVALQSIAEDVNMIKCLFSVVNGVTVEKVASAESES